ncbi:5968_t:CDS:1 [Funneliformis caledonium]|uniref:5968_t:CDS:1 n=1 Tax=Funneliformis caledonium TaxID=1117310 RepID=A0A9N9BVW2_9GLOM|nr:5968_t:CDS:1 [Funneliformis caledonium]
MELHFIEPLTAIKIETRGEKKKRKANIFIEFRKSMKRYKPHKMRMTTYSKLISKMWYKLPDEEKNKLRRNYQISRDTDGENMILNPPAESNYVVNDDQFQNIVDPMANVYETNIRNIYLMYYTF